MIFISEKLNSSIPSVRKILASGDLESIRQLVILQKDADFLDINTAMCEDETAAGKAVIDIVIEESDCGIVIDSPSEAVVSELLRYVGGRRECIVNSITVNERHGNIEAAKAHGASVVVMLTDENGIPDTAEKRFENAKKTIELLESNGFTHDRIYVDAVIEAAAANTDGASVTLDTIGMLRNAYPELHITFGLSNISFGLPKRSALNAAFIALAVYRGLDAPICDITSESVRTAAFAAQMLAGRDDFCMEYISEARQ